MTMGGHIRAALPTANAGQYYRVVQY